MKKEIFNDVWALYKKALGCTEEQYENIILPEEEALLAKHKNDAFLKDMLYAINQEIWRR